MSVIQYLYQECTRLPKKWESFSTTTRLPVKYGEVVENLSCLDLTYKNEGAKSLTCVGDNIFLTPDDTDTPTCPTGFITIKTTRKTSICVPAISASLLNVVNSGIERS